MSIHFTVSGLTRNLFHSLGLDHERAPRAARSRTKPVAGMLSGRQIPESAWADYVFEAPDLERHVEIRRRPLIDHECGRFPGKA